jgi:hypothetical protein
MPPSVLYYCYLGVMTAAFGCFLQAFRSRRHTPTHKRWAITGVALSLGGIVVVLAGAYLVGWHVPSRFPGVVIWHRRLAYAATLLIVLLAVSGARRWPIHKRLYVIFLPLYAVVLALAAVGYRP